ncbi:Wzz/FepE/Etk N-terminal domain-containing protein [Actinoplanes sp. NPDC049265]|uniref:Wzz/FepE/Etk N-terminal domain-containing protein n=1 Tax=Actinoplanes sp. NPDC049265 TaxID=3363902 RepID=UPI003722BDF9
MKSREILRRLVRRFGLLLLLTALGGGAGATYAAVKTPTYTAKAYVVTIGAGAEPIVALNYAQAYGRIATTGPILATAGQTLGADRSGLSRVTASTSPDAPVIEITATGTSPDRTATVANAVANGLIALGDTRKGETRVGLAMLAAATPPARPTSPKPPMELAVGAAAGLLIGGLAVLAGVGRGSPASASSTTGASSASVFSTTDASPTTVFSTAGASATGASAAPVGETVVAEPYTEEPAEILSFSGVSRAKQKVLTATPVESSADRPDEPGKEPVRVVGRAVVFRVEEK